MYNEYSINYAGASEKMMNDFKTKLVSAIKTNGYVTVHAAAKMLYGEDAQINPSYQNDEIGWDYNDIATFKVNKIPKQYILTMAQPHALNKKA